MSSLRRNNVVATESPTGFRDIATSKLRPLDHSSVTKDVSALYGLFMVVSSLCLVPMSQVVAVDAVAMRWSESVLEVMSVGFLFFALIRMCDWSGTSRVFPRKRRQSAQQRGNMLGRALDNGPYNHFPKPTPCHCEIPQVESGSLYLKVGCMIFTVGSMIYACVTLGIVLENSNAFCWVMAFNPSLFIVHQFLQLLFIFRSSHFSLRRYPVLGRFGLMHLVATNLCLAVRVLVDETIHKFAELSERPTLGHSGEYIMEADAGAYLRPCWDDKSIMCDVFRFAAPVLYPCIVEVALISAGILFVMWQGPRAFIPERSPSENVARNNKGSHYRIDCDQAVIGLFVGLLVVVATLIGLAVFYWAINDPDFQRIGVIHWQTMEISLNILGLLCVIFCIVQFVGKLRKVHTRLTSNQRLDDALLLVAMIGVYANSLLNFLAVSEAASGLLKSLAISSSVLNLVQATVQTIFLFDASTRIHIRLSDAQEYKPAKQTLTLLLIVNFCLWATKVFCAMDTDATPLQRDFYGAKQWTVILHIVVPLMIFYRFHSTVCIFEIWKKAYKYDRTPVSVYRSNVAA